MPSLEWYAYEFLGANSVMMYTMGLSAVGKLGRVARMSGTR